MLVPPACCALQAPRRRWRGATRLSWTWWVGCSPRLHARSRTGASAAEAERALTHLVAGLAALPAVRLTASHTAPSRHPTGPAGPHQVQVRRSRQGFFCFVGSTCSLRLRLASARCAELPRPTVLHAAPPPSRHTRSGLQGCVRALVHPGGLRGAAPLDPRPGGGGEAAGLESLSKRLPHCRLCLPQHVLSPPGGARPALPPTPAPPTCRPARSCSMRWSGAASPPTCTRPSRCPWPLASSPASWASPPRQAAAAALPCLVAPATGAPACWRHPPAFPFAPCRPCRWPPCWLPPATPSPAACGPSNPAGPRPAGGQHRHALLRLLQRPRRRRRSERAWATGTLLAAPSRALHAALLRPPASPPARPSPGCLAPCTALLLCAWPLAGAGRIHGEAGGEQGGQPRWRPHQQGGGGQQAACAQWLVVGGSTQRARGCPAWHFKCSSHSLPTRPHAPAPPPPPPCAPPAARCWRARSRAGA